MPGVCLSARRLLVPANSHTAACRCMRHHNEFGYQSATMESMSDVRCNSRRITGVKGVAGSNPVIPTVQGVSAGQTMRKPPFSYARMVFPGLSVPLIDPLTREVWRCRYWTWTG